MEDEYTMECWPVHAPEYTIILTVRVTDDGNVVFSVVPNPDYLAITRQVVEGD